MTMFFVTVSESTEMFNIFKLHNMHVTMSIRDKQTKMFARVMDLVPHHVGDDKYKYLKEILYKIKKLE